MIRINLLGQPKPKAKRRAVPLEATLQILLLVSSLAVAVIFSFIIWFTTSRDVTQAENDIKRLKGQKTELENLEKQIEEFGKQKVILEQRVQVIQELQRNRTGAEEMLDRIATTVARSETLWLTLMTRKGNTLTIEGTAGSIQAVANFITELRRSGYFDKIEIKESRQDDKNPAVQTFLFSLSAEVVLPKSQSGGSATPGQI